MSTAQKTTTDPDGQQGNGGPPTTPPTTPPTPSPTPSPTPPGPNPPQPPTPSWRGCTSGLPQKWSATAAWRQSVQRSRIMFLDELLRLELTDDASKQEREFLINDLLEDANRASTQKVGLRKWWWGTEVERAWARLNEVEERTVDLLPQEELLARAADTSARGGFYLKTDDKRLQDLEALRMKAAKSDPPAPPAGLRPSIVEVLRATHTQSERANQEARYLRNRLLIASAASLLFAVLLVAAQWRLPDAAFAGSISNWHGPAWAYLVVLMLFGGVGALFTAIPALSRIPSDFGPFNLPLQQALLKIVFGPLVAVIGLAILATNAVHVGPPATWPALLLIAVVFGAGQHAVTRYVDQRADEILTAVVPSPKSQTS